MNKQEIQFISAQPAASSVPALRKAVRKRKGSGLKSLKSSLLRDRSLYLLALPGVLFFLVFKYVPIWGILISFQDYSPFLGMAGSQWVGFKHFAEFFSSPDFARMLRNTLAISLLNLLLYFPFPVIVALLLNELRSAAYKQIVQTVIYMPHFLSWVIIAGLTFLLFYEGRGAGQ